MMAERPVFIPINIGNMLTKEHIISFKWHAGMSISQKQKSITSLHSSIIISTGISRILEISSKSTDCIGVTASAFNLRLEIENTRNSVEAFFQGSKKYEYGGPFRDIYNVSSRNAKKDERHSKSGRLVGFDLFGQEWELLPKTAFYDWLYINALMQNPDISNALLEFDAFTDIEFNPSKSINCQARSAALYVSLVRRDILMNAIKNKNSFIFIVRNGQTQPEQSNLDFS